MASTIPKPTSPKPIDQQIFPETMRLLQRVKKKVEINSSNSPQNITGLHPTALSHCINNLNISVDIKELDRADVHSVLTDFYLKKNIMPTPRELFDGVGRKLSAPIYMDIDNFRKLLVKMGYAFKIIDPLMTTPVVIEKTQVTFERYEYLKNIIQFREEGKNIIFVDESAVESNGNYLNVKQSFNFSKQCPDVWQQKYIYGISGKGIHCLKEITDFAEDNFTAWILDDLMRHLNSPTVVVFNKDKHHQSNEKPPTLDTVKVDMIAWLERNQIPYDPDMMKHELFNLVQKYTKRKLVYKIDKLLNANGHTVLRIPDSIKRLSPASTIFNTIKNELINYIAELDAKNQTNCTNAELNEVLKGLMGGFTEDQLKQCWDLIAVEEIQQLIVDLEVDSVFDQLVEKLRTLIIDNYEHVHDESLSDAPSCEDTE